MTTATPPGTGGPAASHRAADFRLLRALKLGSFHIGSSAADLLVSAVWNRILIVDLGSAAWPVSLLSAVRYFLAPLSLWAGHRSDTRPVLGSRRLVYIWAGRLLMLISLPLLPLTTVVLARDLSSALGWGMAFAALSVFGAGTLISGPAYLALVHDSVPYARRGQAIAVVQFVLVASFAFLPALYALAMPVYEADAYLRLALAGMSGAGLFWFLSVWKEERPGRRAAPAVEHPPLRAALKGIWADLRTRRYAIFLSASAFFAFMQDAVLEPFGGDVFGLPVGETTRFNAYWGSGVLLGMLATMALTRRWRPEQQVSTTAWGLAALAVPLLALGATSAWESLALVRPTLILFGLGFGIFTVGGVSLLMAMSREWQAGTYLALWSVIQLISRGAGIAAGGAVRDLALALTGSYGGAYATVFVIEALGVAACIGLLRRVDIRGFAADRIGEREGEYLAAAAD